MTFVQFSHVLFEAAIAIACLVLAILVFRTRKKESVTAWILEGMILSVMLFNIADALVDYFRGDVIGAELIIVRTSNLLVFVFLYFFVMFATAYIGRILYFHNSEKPVSGKLQNMIYALCGAGILVILISQIFSLIRGFSSQSRAYWLNSFGIHLVIVQIAFLLILVLILQNRGLFHLMEFKVVFVYAALSLIAPALQVLFYNFAIFNAVSFIVVFLNTIVYLWETSDNTIHKRDICLTASNIDMMSEDFAGFLSRSGVSRRTTITVRLKMEETILRMQEKFGEQAKVDFLVVTAFGRPSVQITLEGELHNPLAESDTEVRDWSMEMLRGTTVSPRYSYFSGKNYVRLTLPKQKTNPALTMLACILAGFLLGALAEVSMSAEGLELFRGHLLDPAYNLLINILSCAAGPVIFFMVINTILNTGAMSRQGISSRMVVGRYFLISGAMAALAVALLCAFVIDLVHAGRPGSEEIQQFVEYIINLVPQDIFDPITEANTPQLLLLAFVLGCAVVVIGPRGNTLTDLFRQANLVGMRIAEWIGKLIPYFGVLIVAYAVIMAQMSSFAMLGVMLLSVIVISSLCAAAAILYVSLTKGVKAGTIMKKCLASLKYAFRTGSAYTAYEASEECCVKELGVRKSYALTSLPLGTVLYMPANAMGAVVFIAFAEVVSDMSISPLWMVAAIVLSVILIAATPPIPGANCMAYMMIISILGIDKQFIILALLFDILFSSFSTAANQLMLQMELIVQADRRGMLDKEKLAEK